MQNGRPTRYKKELDQIAHSMCLLGATDKEIAHAFGVKEQTINNWKKKHKSFFESLKAGKEEADGAVARSLYNRALGYEHPEEKVFQYEGNAVRVQTKRRYAPDTTACIFWLKNRQPQKWRDKQEHVITGDIEIVPAPKPEDIDGED